MALHEQHDEQDQEQDEYPGLFRSFFLWLSEIEWLAALCGFITVRWRALKIQCARGWFHFRRGQQYRQQRDQQALASSRVAKTARKIGNTPAGVYGLYQTNRAWFFTTISGTIGLILLLLWFYDYWTTKPVSDETMIMAEESDLGTPAKLVSESETPLIITEEEPDEPFEFPELETPEVTLPEIDTPVVELTVKPGLIFEEKLDEQFLVASPEIPNRFESPATLPDEWQPYQERPPELPEAPVVEPELEPEPSDFPRLTFDLDEPAEEVEEIEEAKIHIEKVFPDNLSVGEAFQYVLLVTNLGSQMVAQTEVKETIEKSFKVESTFPVARVDLQDLNWTLNDIAPGEQRRIEIHLRPTSTGPKESIASVRPQVEAKSSTKVEEPKLHLTVQQPRQARIGQWLPVTFIVRNVGAGRVSNITLHTDLPEQVEHDKGEKLAIRIASLEPGESRQLKLAPQAKRVGRAQLNMKLMAAGFEQNVSRTTEIASHPRKGKTQPAKTAAPAPCCPGPVSYPVYQPVYSQPMYYQPVMGMNWYRNPIGRW